MFDLSFHAESIVPVPFAATPLLHLKLRIDTSSAAIEIRSMQLQCQVRIEPTRRRYSPAEQERLLDLFAEPARWGQTLRSMLWLHTGANVQPFQGSTVVDIPLPCSFDFNVAATKYFYALEEGEIPLCLLFSGTIFYNDPDAGLQITQVPWEKEAVCRLPVATWKSMMDMHYPETAWLCLPRPLFDQLYHYKRRHGIPMFEQALESLLAAAAAENVVPGTHA